MSISYSFIDNVSYGTDDVNGITACLTGAGIAPFTSKSAYSTSDFNALTAAVVGSGTSLGGCKCTKSGNTVTVAQGIIYFENGVVLCVDSGKYTVAVTANTAGYVYAYFNNSLQTADIVFGETLPDSGYYVKLAQISTGGALTDCREFARSKAATFGANAAVTKTFTYQTPTLSAGKYIYGKISDIDLSKFNYAIIQYVNSDNYGTNAVFDLTANKFLFSVHGNYYDSTVGYDTNKLCTGSNNVIYYITKTNNELRMLTSSSSYVDATEYTVTFV